MSATGGKRTFTLKLYCSEASVAQFPCGLSGLRMRPVAITMALGLCIGLASAGSLYLWPRPDGVPATVWAGFTPLEGLTWNWCEGTQSGAINWRADRELGLSLWLVPDRACHNARGGAGRVMSWHGDGRLRFPFHPSEPRRGGGNACPFEIAPAERASMTAALDEAIGQTSDSNRLRLLTEARTSIAKLGSLRTEHGGGGCVSTDD